MDGPAAKPPGSGATDAKQGTTKTTEEQRAALQESLENFVECLRELEIVLEDQPDQLHTRVYVYK